MLSLKLTPLAAAGGGGSALSFIHGTTEGVSPGEQFHIDSSGNVYLVATSSQPPIFDYNGALTVKLPPDLSSMTYERNFDGNGSNDDGNNLVSDGAGYNYLGCYGFYYAQGLNQNRPWFIKVAQSNGAVNGYWVMGYSSFYLAYPKFSQVASSTQQYVLLHDYNGHGSLGHNIVFATLNFSSNTATNVRYYGGTNNNGTSSTGAAYYSGYWYISGQSNEVTGDGTDKAFIAKFDTAGNFQWWRPYGTSSQNNYGGCVAVDSSGNVYSVYRRRNDAEGRWDPVLQKHNSSGTKQWERAWSVANAELRNLYIDASNRLFAVGSYNPGGGSRLIVAEINPSTPAVIWQNELKFVTGSANTFTFTSEQGNLLSENPDGLLCVLFQANDSGSALGTNSATGILNSISKDGDDSGQTFGTQIEYVTSTGLTLSSITSTTYSTSSLSAGSVSSPSLAYYASPTNISTSTTQLGFLTT